MLVYNYNFIMFLFSLYPYFVRNIYNMVNEAIIGIILRLVFILKIYAILNENINPKILNITKAKYKHLLLSILNRQKVVSIVNNINIINIISPM